LKHFSFRAALLVAAFASILSAQVVTPPAPATGSSVNQMLYNTATMPVVGVACPSYNLQYLNYQTGEERLCVNATIQPGLLTGSTLGTAIASASTIAPLAPVTHITGTTNVVNITPPTAFAQTGAVGCITLIPDGLWSTTNAGNIAIASTGVVSKALTECYDNATSKWYPSY
jgi:hypothetical protein